VAVTLQQSNGMMDVASSTGLTTRTAAVLAYLGWWVTGLLFWGLERRDRVVRFHAVQSTIVFGLLALLIALLAMTALVLLTFAPAGFAILLWAAFLTWLASVLFWIVTIWAVGTGRTLRVPLAADLAERWTTHV
jgi:uncharacterized membrane protein